MGVDRTSEFFNTVTALQRNTKQTDEISSFSTPSSFSAASSSTVYHMNHVPEGPATQFTKAAASISRGVHETTLKLERLSKLAKKQSLYEDNSAKVHELTVAIKGDLQILDSDLKALQQFVDTERARTTRNSRENSTAIVDNLKTQLAFTTKSFAEVLQVRTKTLKEQHHRQKAFGDPSIALPRSKANRFVDDNAQDAAQEQKMVPQEDAYLSSRAQEVESIEGMIHELGQMYVKLTTIISLHGEMTIRIDENMDNALENTESGFRELITARDRMSSNQWLILKIFAVLIAFSTFFVVFVA